MRDLIDRQAATTIPILPIEHRKYQTMNIDDAYDLGWLDCQNCIEKLPPAQPEQKKGHWAYWEKSVEFEFGTIKLPLCRCSECNVVQDMDRVATMRFCPNCGAKMEKEQKHLGNKCDSVFLDEVRGEKDE